MTSIDRFWFIIAVVAAMMAIFQASSGAGLPAMMTVGFALFAMNRAVR